MTKNIVIIPTYNEKENIEAIIRAIFSQKIPFDILVVDDGSPDNTANIVKSLQKTFDNRLFLIERAGKLGLGTAYITGFYYAIEANYDYIFEMDADFSHNPNDLVLLYKACLHEGADVCIGSRYKCGVNVVNWPIGRVIMSYYASVFVRLVTGMPIKDATAGFVAYSRKVLMNIDLERIKMKGYGFQIEMKYTAWKLGYNINELPIIFTDRKAGTSKMSSGIFGEAFWGVIMLKLRRFKKKKER